MKHPHRHHHAITAGRSAAEWSSGQQMALAQLSQAAPADLVRYAARLIADAAERTERGDLSHLALRINEISREISGEPTPSPSQEGNQVADETSALHPDARP